MSRKHIKHFKSSIEKKIIDDSNDLLTLNICKTQYDVVLLTDDDIYVDIVNSIEDVTSKLTLKIALIIISNWKSYVQISLYVGSSNVKYDQSQNFRNFIELHETHAYFDVNIIQNIEIKNINQQSNLLDFMQEKLFRNDLSRELIYQMTIKYDSNFICQCEFLFDQIYSMLSQAQDLILYSRDRILRLMINTNSHVTIVLNEFLKKLQTNVFDYSTFYLEHSRFIFYSWKIISLLKVDRWCMYSSRSLWTFDRSISRYMIMTQYTNMKSSSTRVSRSRKAIFSFELWTFSTRKTYILSNFWKYSTN
jgi:hypothetical protein